MKAARGTGPGARLGPESKGRRVLFGAVVTLCLLLMTGASVAGSEGEYRGFVNVGRDVGAVRVRLRLESRSAGSADEPHYVSGALGAEYGMGAHLVVGGYYSRVETESGTEWKLEQRPYGDVTVTTKWAAANLSDRNRLEVRIRDGESTLRYRNRARVSAGLGRTPLVASADGELFYDLETGEVATTRVTAGVDMRMAASLRLGISYINERRLKDDRWSVVHGLGVALSVDLQG